MAELAIECPPTVEVNTAANRIGTINDTPPPRAESQPNSRIREFLKKHHEQRTPSSRDATESGNSGDEQQRQQANQSPPPNCSICLGRVKSKCFTDSCMHQFCFSCLLEWSKIKPECPLCKQTFKSIIHNVTSMDNYDLYKVETQQRAVSWINLTNSFQPVDVDLNYLLTATLPTYRIHRPDVGRSRLFHLFRHDSALTQRFAETYPNEAIPTRFSGTAWRSYVYTRQLYAEPLNDLSGQSRDISAAFYRANPAQMHRLMPWLNRELLCLCVHNEEPISYVVQTIEHLIKTYDMTSPDFRTRVRACVPDHTEHFIHELINYARSPYDLVGYDRYVTYVPRFESDNNEILISSSSEDGSDLEWLGPVVGPVIDIDDIIMADMNTNTIATASNTTAGESSSGNGGGSSDNRTENTENIEQAGASTSQGTTKSNTTSATILNLSGDDSDEEEITNYLHRKPQATAEEVIRGRQGPSPKSASGSKENGETQNNSERSEESTDRTVIVAPNSQAKAPSEPDNETPTTSQASTVINTIEDANAIPKVEPNTQTTPQQEIINADSDSDSDECLFVCAKKPPHLRTPEYVELNSDSDSDVVFVSSVTVKTEVPRAISHLEKSNVIVSAFSAHSGNAAADVPTQCESSTNIVVSNSRRKRGAAAQNNSNAAATATITYSGQNTSFDPKPSTSVVQWLIHSPDEQHSNVTPMNLSNYCKPRLSTTIRVSRGKRIYESSSSDASDDDGKSTDEVSTTTSSTKTSEDIESSDEEFVPKSETSLKRRVSNNDGPSLVPQKTKRFRKRTRAMTDKRVTRPKRVATAKSKRQVSRRVSTTTTESSLSSEEDDDEDMSE